MPTVTLPTIDQNETDLPKMVKSLLNAYVMMTEEMTFLLNNLDTKNINYLSADKIDVGTLNAGLVTIKSALNNGASITIDGTGMTINDGTKDTFKADINGKVTMTGAQIQSSANSYPRVEMSSDNNAFSAYFTSSSFLQITPSGTSNAPLLTVITPQINTILGPFSDIFWISATGGSVGLSGNKVKLLPDGNVEVPSWNQLVNISTGTSMSTELNNKATKGVSTSLSGSANGGIPIGTVFKDVNGVSYTWMGIPSHSHAQN